jgi:hypothetical protein
MMGKNGKAERRYITVKYFLGTGTTETRHALSLY